MSLTIRASGNRLVWCFSQCLLACLLAAPAAHASAKENKEKTAKRACLSGDYTKGVSILSDLYVDTNDLTHIFNQGRCFEQNGRYEDAINRFREYARKLKDAGRPADAQVERHIAECQTMLDSRATTPTESAAAPTRAPATSAEQPATVPAAAEPTAAPLPPIAESRLPPAAAATGEASPAESVRAPAPEARSGSPLRIAGIAAFAVGVAGLATGLVLNLKANGLADEMDSSTTSYSRSKESTRASYQTWGWVGYGVGAACVAAGTALYLVGYSVGRGRLALLPTGGPGQAGAVLQGAF